MPRSGRPFTGPFALAQETPDGETPQASAVGAGLPRRTVAITGHRGCIVRSNGACENLGPIRRRRLPTPRNSPRWPRRSPRRWQASLTRSTTRNGIGSRRVSGTGTVSGWPRRRCTSISMTATMCSWPWSWWCTTSAATTGLGRGRTCRSRSTSSARGTAAHRRCGSKTRHRTLVLEVASPSTAENDARDKAQEYLGIGGREYSRLDPTGTLMGRRWRATDLYAVGTAG